MAYDPNIHHRRSIRLPGYDYAQAGAYFVTVCTYWREMLFEDDRLRAMVEEVWQAVTAAHDANPADGFVVMPNHVHGIIWIATDAVVGAQQHHREAQRKMGRLVPAAAVLDADRHVAAPLRRVIPGSLGAVARAFKSATAKRINNIRGTPGARVWQRNYYEHIIRDEDELTRVRQYIRDNPAKWAGDPDNPKSWPRTP